MKHLPKVSVIIPVYNTQAYVRQAVESILQQTLPELEVIVINDGSTDGSEEILQELARQDERVQVYAQANQGQSVARNTGIKHATGRFLYFMDSDDLLEADALELCYEKGETEQLDFVFFDATIFTESNTPTPPVMNYNRQTCIVENRVYTGQELMQIQLEHGKYTPSPCLNLIRRSFLADKEVLFYPGIIHEDQLFNALLYLQARRGMYLCRSFFKRRFRAGSTMTRRYSWQNMEGYLTVTRELLGFGITQPALTQTTIDLALRQMLNAAVWQAHALPLGQKLKLFCICLSRYQKYISPRTLAVLLFKKARTTRPSHEDS